MNTQQPPRAKKSLGQNFLVDKNTCERIVNALMIQPEDHVIEIGPGRGALTTIINDREWGSFRALEMDDELAEILEDKLDGVEIVRGDALKFDWAGENRQPLRICGNLPYNVGSKLIWDIVSKVQKYERAVFMVQHEVAQRLTADSGSKKYGALTAWVKNFAETQYLFKVPPTVFRPQPKVDSAIVAFKPLATDRRPQDAEALRNILNTCFQKRRKQLHNILKLQWNDSIDVWLEEQGLARSVRPEALTPAQFEQLSRLVPCGIS